MKNKNGFSLIELLISIIVASIVILTAGGLSRISLHSFYKELSKQQIYNDSSYGLKLIRNRFRNAEASSVVRINTSASSFWVGTTLLEIGNSAFGIYKVNNSSAREFMYLPDKSFENNCKAVNIPNDKKCEVLLAVPDGDLMWEIACDPSDPSCSSSKILTVVLKRVTENNPIPFHVETTVARRNP